MHSPSRNDKITHGPRLTVSKSYDPSCPPHHVFPAENDCVSITTDEEGDFSSSLDCTSPQRQRFNSEEFSDARSKKTRASIHAPFKNIFSYKQQNKDFHKYFNDIPDEERLLVVYNCALVRGTLLIQGHLYVSQNWICFRANIFTFETMVQMRIKDITSIRKGKTIKVFPNAIVLERVNQPEVRFTSFIDRNAAYKVIDNLLLVYHDPTQCLEQNSTLWGLVLKRYHSSNDLTTLLQKQGWSPPKRAVSTSNLQDSDNEFQDALIDKVFDQ